MHNMQDYTEQLFLLQQQHHQSLKHSQNPNHEILQLQDLIFSSQVPQTLNPSRSQDPFQDDHHHHFRILSDGFVGRPGSGPFMLQTEFGKMSAQEIMDAKAAAASKSHSEAERRRRERINSHLAKLRSILPSTTKTDKATLLAEVIQHLKDLKHQTSHITETGLIPTELNELTVVASDIDKDGNFVVKASICCEDRSDFIPDLIKTLKTLNLKTLKAEISTLGGRLKNILFITGEECFSKNYSAAGDQQKDLQCFLSSLQEALKGVIDKDIHQSVKRQRTNNNVQFL